LENQKFDKMAKSKKSSEIFKINTGNKNVLDIAQHCFDVVNIFVAMLDSEGRITLINKKGIDLLGYSRQEMIGKHFIEEYIFKGERNKAIKFFNKAFDDRTRNPENTVYHLLKKSGKKVIVEARHVIMKDDDGNMTGILISGEDVTGYVKNQRDLQKDLDLYRILANNIPDINLFLFDEDCRFILAEGNEMRNNGFSREYFEDKTIGELPNIEIRDIWIPLFKRALEGEEISTEYMTGSYYYLIWVLPIKNDKDEVYSGMAITQNITEEKITARQLEESKEEAEKANMAKSEFLARVSHEIRTPLNAVLGFTEQLLQTKLTKQQEDYLKIIDKSSEHLLSLINDILVLSKIEARQIRFDAHPFKIANTVEYVFNALMVKANEKKIRFSYDIDEAMDMVLLGDSFRLRQILINLLNNAIKFTNRGYVELKCFLQDETKKQVTVRFDIIDTGIGISSKNLIKIFEEFKQADSGITMKYGGTGLGLTICKNLIEMQNGSLKVSSKENMGSTFTFTLPYKKGKQSDLVPTSMGEEDSDKLKGKNALLVDDDSVNRLLAKTILEKFQCVVDIANNGSEAIEKLTEKKFDIMVLDIHMPDISGIDVARFLREKKKDASTKIIAVTAAAMKDDIQQYFEVGIDDFLIKPFKEVYLFNKMCEVLDIRNNENKQQPVSEIILKEELSPKPYSFNGLKKMAGGNKSFVNKMLNTFIDNTNQSIGKFENGIKNNDWKMIGETAHKIIPGFRHLEVNEVVSQLVEIKTKTLVDKNYKGVPKMVETTVESMKDLIEKLQDELE